MTSFDTVILHFCRLGPAGLAPRAPGTAGSLLATLLAPLLFLPLSLPWRLVALLALFMLGFGGFSAASGWKDVALLLAAFLFFRFFDILKPWPVHASESWLPSGWGIMIDDVLAGIWALLCMSVLMLVINLMFPGSLTL